MTVLSSSAIKVAYKAEAAYAAGNHATDKYACDPFAVGEVADLTVMNLIADTSTFGLIEVERASFRPPGKGANSRVVFDQGYRYKEFKITVFVQNMTWITAAQQAAAGAIPTSYVFHVEIPGVNGAMDYFDICGCVLTDYELSASGNEFPKETLTFRYYDIVNGVAVTNLVAFDYTQPSIHKDILLTIDGDAYHGVGTAAGGGLKSLSLTVTNVTLDDMVAGKYQRFDPYLVSRDVTLKANYYDDVAALLGDNLALGGSLTAINKVTIKVYLDGTNCIQMTNCYLDSDNLGTIGAEMKIIEHESTFMIEDSTISITT